jgi:hypothetical protein
MTFQPGNANDREISRAELLPFLTSFGDLRRRAFLWPGVTLAVFSAALLVFAAVDSEPGFFWCLAGLISLANLYLIYLACGKKMPFLFVFLIAVFAFGLDILLTPVIIGVETVLPELISPGLAEETAKAIPLLLVLGFGLLLSHPWQRKFGLREPLDGILLAAASATGVRLSRNDVHLRAEIRRADQHPAAPGQRLQPHRLRRDARLFHRASGDAPPPGKARADRRGDRFRRRQCAARSVGYDALLRHQAGDYQPGP